MNFPTIYSPTPLGYFLQPHGQPVQTLRSVSSMPDLHTTTITTAAQAQPIVPQKHSSDCHCLNCSLYKQQMPSMSGTVPGQPTYILVPAPPTVQQTEAK
jgi:hypothetical protein